MKTVSYTLQMDESMFRRAESEAARRSQSLDDTFKFALSVGLASLGTEEAIVDTWEKLGPAPEIDYAKL